jgi:membrane protein insertase Oxa1/YidC/SpoIIIJ
MNDNIQRPNSYLKTISIIHIALLIGQTIFAIVAFFINRSTTIELNNAADPFFVVMIALAIGSFIASTILFKKNLEKAKEQEDAKSKLAQYQSALIIRYALLEGPSLFGIVVYLLTGNLFYLMVSVIIILYFLSLRLTKDGIKDDLQLSYDEEETL